AYAETDGKGKTLVHIGAPGGKGKQTTTDITSFSSAPERILFAGGHWFVIANEGTRRAAVIGPSGRTENQIGSFGEAFLSHARGLELVGPAEKLRPLMLPAKYALYEGPSLQQQASGGHLFFSLTVDPLNPDQIAARKKGARVLHVFEAAVGSAKATLLGQVPL